MKNSGGLNSHLHLRGLELCVFLGWPENERLEKQVVLLDIEIKLAEPPKACVTDHLDDTFCYAELIAEIQDKVRTPVFHLIEHLCHEIYQLIKPRLPRQAQLSVRVTKYPKIPGLTGGVIFSYGDEK